MVVYREASAPHCEYINKTNVYDNWNIMCHGYFIGRPPLCCHFEKDLGVVIDHAEPQISPAVQDESLKLCNCFKHLDIQF